MSVIPAQTYGIFSILIRINFHTTSKGSEYVKAKLSKTTVTFLLIPTIITPVVLLCIEMQIAVYSHYSFPSSRQGSHHIKMVSGRRRSAPKMGYCMWYLIYMINTRRLKLKSATYTPSPLWNSIVTCECRDASPSNGILRDMFDSLELTQKILVPCRR